MAVPVDHISLAEAFTRFCDAFDTDGILIAPEPERENCNSDREYEEAMHHHGAVWKKLHNEAIASFRAELALEYFYAFFEREGKPHLYKIEAQEWINADTRLIRHFCTEPRAIQKILDDEHNPSDLDPFVHEETFDKWMKRSFPKSEILTNRTGDQSLAVNDTTDSAGPAPVVDEAATSSKKARTKKATATRRERTHDKLRKTIEVLYKKYDHVMNEYGHSNRKVAEAMAKDCGTRHGYRVIDRIIRGDYPHADTVIAEMKETGYPDPPWLQR